MNLSHHTDWLLVVEDQPDLWKLLELYLKRLLPDVPVTHVIDNVAAETYLQACVDQQRPLPRLIITNLYMPRLEDGLSLLTSLREPGSPYQAIPVIVMSSSADREDHEEIIRRGFAYATKPINVAERNRFFSVIQDYWINSASAQAN